MVQPTLENVLLNIDFVLFFVMVATCTCVRVAQDSWGQTQQHVDTVLCASSEVILVWPSDRSHSTHTLVYERAPHIQWVHTIPYNTIREAVPLKRMFTHSVSHAHFLFTFSLRDVQTRTRMAQGVRSANVKPLHPTFSILMFHPPSLLFPHGHFETPFPSAQSLPDFTRPESAGQAHFRTSGEEFGYLADPTHSTGYEPKEFDKITSADGDTTPINEPNYDNISDFSKITRENTGLFGFPQC